MPSFPPPSTLMKAIIELSAKSGATGEYPVPCVTLRVLDRYGGWAEVLFRVDSGASVSALPISLARFLTRLASVSRLILFDKRGTGLSDRVADMPSLEVRMDDVRAVLDAVHRLPGHPTAAEVFDAVRATRPRIAFGTVYTALQDRESTRLNSSHRSLSRMPSSA